MTPATALPWQVDDDFRILDADGGSIIAPTECDAMLGECYKAEDAAYIVHACNHHAELVKALRDLREHEVLDEDDSRLVNARIQADIILDKLSTK